MIEAARLSILLSILMRRYVATAMGKPRLAMAFNKSSMATPPSNASIKEYADKEGQERDKTFFMDMFVGGGLAVSRKQLDN